MKWYLRKTAQRPLASLHDSYVVRKHPSQREKIQQLRGDEQRWLLIVLDACRYDKLADVFDEFFVGQVEPVVSSGLDTFEYVRETWPGEYELPYVTAAAPINRTDFDFDSSDPARTQGISATGERLEQKYDGYVPVEHLNRIIEVWRSDWNEELRVCPPEPVTEQALSIFESENPRRAVVHYFQPHAPYIGEVRELDQRDDPSPRLKGGALAADIWERAKAGEISRPELSRLYAANMRRALHSVARLVAESNFDRTVLIGDHGEALGEYGRYGHGIEHPYVRTVPWAEIESVNPGLTRVGEYGESEHVGDRDGDVVDVLQKLGYLE